MENEVIYVVGWSKGSYDDYQDGQLCWHTDKKLCKAYARKAQAEVKKLLKKKKKINALQQEVLKSKTAYNINYTQLAEQIRNLKSKYDPELSDYHFDDIQYFVYELPKLKEIT